MTDPISEPTLAITPNWHTSELAQFGYEDIKAASRGSWPLADTLEPGVAAALKARIDGDQA